MRSILTKGDKTMKNTENKIKNKMMVALYEWKYLNILVQFKSYMHRPIFMQQRQLM